jgi:uncharacterized protein
MLSFRPKGRLPRRPQVFVTAATGIVAGLTGLLWGVRVDTTRLETVEIRVPVRRLPTTFDGLRIVQFSDLHIWRLMSRQYMRHVVDEALRLAPDLVVITGDHIQGFSEREALLLQRVASRLTAPRGVYAILGTHDHYLGHVGSVIGALQRAGVTLLRNASVPISEGESTIYIVGLDNVQEKRADISLAMAAVPANGCAILLVHEPDFADCAACDERIVLQLSGHSHGGQVRMRGLPCYTPPLGRKYPRGLHHVGDMWVYANRGIGTAFVPLRVNCRPEITVIELTTQE